MSALIGSHPRTGERYSEWVVLSETGKKNIANQPMFSCQCVCGNVRNVSSAALRFAKSKNCGCRRYAALKVNLSKHGRGTPEYVAWSHIKQRCLNPDDHGYQDYGGRGISVCSRWMDFDNFYSDMGPRPSAKHSIDRVDNNRGYEPGNCRWTTSDIQARNTRRNRSLEFNGEKLTVADWTKRLGFGRGAIPGRIKRGWSTEKILTTPLIETARLIKQRREKAK